ncbi:MAG: hypothetical protein AAF721_16115 [Myxococcota bacterium]
MNLTSAPSPRASLIALAEQRTGEQPAAGALQLARAIVQARKTMFEAPWLVDGDALPRERAAAEAQLKHQLTAALDQGFVLHDPLHPEFRVLDQHNQFGLVNPDNRYLIASICTPGTYVIRGKRGTSADLQIEVGGGCAGFNDEVNSTPIDQLALPRLKVDDDGCFEIVISSRRTGRNWLCNTAGGVTATSVLIRESFMDWDNEVSSTWSIERVDTRGTPSPISGRSLVNHQYARAAAYLTASTRAWVDFVSNIYRQTPPNVLLPPKLAEDGLPGQWNAAGLFDIGADQAVVIKLAKSAARYQSIQVGDLWFNSLDYCRRQTSLTAAQARPDGNGDYWLVVSHEDPGVENWLDPSGASTTFVFARWQGLESDHEFTADDLPRAQLVDLDKLRDYLPCDVPHFSPAARVEQLAARKASSLVNPRRF